MPQNYERKCQEWMYNVITIQPAFINNYHQKSGFTFKSSKFLFPTVFSVMLKLFFYGISSQKYLKECIHFAMIGIHLCSVCCGHQF